MSIDAAVVAAVVAALTGYLVARLQASREDRFRFVETKRERYEAFLATAQEIQTETHWLAERADPSALRPEARHDRWNPRASLQALWTRQSAIGLIAPTDVQHSATRVVAYADSLVSHLERGSTEPIDAERDWLARTYGKAVSTFRREARADLGVRGPSRVRWQMTRLMALRRARSRGRRSCH